VQVGAGRLERWVAGFAQRHPGVHPRVHADRVELAAPDGSTAVLYPPFAPFTPPVTPSTDEPTVADAARALVANAHSVPVLRALLIRRGGYACAVLSGEKLIASKVGSRYVQGRTAAGGWSQQRYARRRDGQVDGLVDAAIEVAVRVLLPVSSGDALVTGGDRGLIERVLADVRLSPLRRLRAGPHLEIGDPRSGLVRALAERARAIRITLHEQ
jgi:hypothetical protein